MKKVWIVIGVIVTLLIVGVVGFYFWGTSAKSNQSNIVTFIIEPGTSKTTIAKNLENAGLIRSQYALDMYLFFSKSNIQAGEYELSPSMSPLDMLKKFESGDIKIHSVTVTLLEGKRLEDYAETLANSFGFTKKEFMDAVDNKEFVESLVGNEDYWFLTEDILNSNIYHPLEGYLYPDTYEFLETATPEKVIRTILNYTEDKLDIHKEEILANSYSIHDLFTMASIVEKEADTDTDRRMASQVFYKRLSENWSLGSDVTAFYGAKKEMGKDSETWEVLNDNNPYNTRLTNGSMNGKLPIGPICSPSLSSIVAALYPTDTNYYYFIANTCTGEVTFLETADDFYAKAVELSNNGCM